MAFLVDGGRRSIKQEKAHHKLRRKRASWSTSIVKDGNEFAQRRMFRVTLADTSSRRACAVNKEARSFVLARVLSVEEAPNRRLTKIWTACSSVPRGTTAFHRDYSPQKAVVNSNTRKGRVVGASRDVGRQKASLPLPPSPIFRRTLTFSTSLLFRHNFGENVFKMTNSRRSNIFPWLAHAAV